MLDDMVIVHATNKIDYIKLIYADRYDTTNPMYHSYYRGDINSFVECEYTYHASLESLCAEVASVISQYGEDNVTLDYISWRGVFRILIAQ